MTLSGTWVWRPGNFAWFEPPGEVSTDTQGWMNAGALSISMQTSDGTDASTGLSDIQPGDLLRMGTSGAETPFVVYTVTEFGSLESGYVFYPVAAAGGNGDAPPDGTIVDIECPWVAPTPPANVITWTVSAIATRPNRFLMTVSCAHGSLSEQAATAIGEPVPPQAVIEATGQNLIHRTGCACEGMVAGMTLGMEAAGL